MSRAAGLAVLAAAFLLAAPVTAILLPGVTVLPSALALLAVACVALALFSERKAVRQALAGRQARHGALAAAYTASVFLVLGSVSFLATRHPVRVDLTSTKRHSLLPATELVLDAIPADGPPVEILLVDNGGVGGQVLHPLRRLLAESGKHVRVSHVEALEKPELVRQLALQHFPAAVVRFAPPGEDAPRVERTDVVTEQSIAGAVERALSGKRLIAYVTAGHGEMAAADRGPDGFLVATRLLAEDNFEVRQLFLGGDDIRDADLLVIPGPEADFLPPEVETIDRYLRSGGHLLILLGPSPAPGAHERLASWLREKLGVLAEESLVADLDSLLHAGAAEKLIVRPEGTHPVVRDLDKVIIAPLCRRVDREVHLPVGASVETILRSGERSWVETDLSSGRIAFDGDEPPGPHPLAVAGTLKVPGTQVEGRFVVLGSSRLASNVDLVQTGNAELFDAAVAWLTAREEVAAARKASKRDATVVVAESQGMLLLLASAVVPLVVLLAGLATYLHRRRL